MKNFKKYIKINRMVSWLIFATITLFGFIVAVFDPSGWILGNKTEIFFLVYIPIQFTSFLFAIISLLLKFKRYRVGSLDVGVHEVCVYVGFSNRFLYVDGVLCDNYHATSFNIRPLSHTIEGGETITVLFPKLGSKFLVKYGNHFIEPEPENNN